MKKLFALVFLFILCEEAIAQQYLEKRLKAQKVKKSIYMKILNDRVLFSPDEHNDLSFAPPLKENEEPIFGATHESFQLIFDFYNPVRYNVSVKQNQKEDPTYEAARDFISSVTAMGRLVTDSETLNGQKRSTSTASADVAKVAALKRVMADSLVINSIISSSDAEVAANFSLSKAALIQVTEKKLKDPKLLLPVLNSTTSRTTPILLNWLLWLQQSQNTCQSESNIFQTIVDVEKYLYDLKIDPKNISGYKGTQTGFETVVKSVFDSLYAATTYGQYVRMLTIAGEISKQLASANSNTKDKLSEMVKTLSGDAELFKAAPDANQQTVGVCNIFARYSQAVLISYTDLIADAIRKRELSLNEFNKVLDYCKKFNIENPESDSRNVIQNYRFRYEIDVVSGKVNDVTLIVRKYEINKDNYTLKEVQNQSLAFQAVENSNAVFETAAGIFYSGVVYPQYATSTTPSGEIVADAGTIGPKAMGALLGNIVFAHKWGPFYPMVQAGVGSAKNYPALMAGIGLRSFAFQNANFSLSMGVVTTWVQSLNKLSVGDPVSGQAEIEKDLVYKFQSPPSFYIGLSFSF